MTYDDPIVAEIRVLREALAAKFNYDLKAICEDIKRQERESGEAYVSFPPRRVPVVRPAHEMNAVRYIVMIRRTATGYSVDVPDVPGCIATGSTVEHAKQMIAEAIELHLDLMQQHGETLPNPSHSITFDVDEDGGEELCTWVEVNVPLPSVP